MKRVFLGIGTNLDDRENYLKEAVAKIEEFIGRVTASSSVYETASWGFVAENEFLNIVVKAETDLAPNDLLEKIHMIETLLGRVRNEKRYISRVIDIDILFYEDLVIDEISLKIPHPLMQDRKFVLVPFFEIEPELVHPVLRKTI